MCKLLVFFMCFVTSGVMAQTTLETVRARGTLVCGVNGAGLAGFTNLASDGSYSGFDVDFCKAIAAAVLGDATKVTFYGLSAQERFTALQQGQVDVLIRNTVWTLSRDATLGLSFAPPTFYGGQGFMTRTASNLQTLADLNGTTICVQADTILEVNLEAVLTAKAIPYTPLTFQEQSQVIAAYEKGECLAWTTDKTSLVTVLTQLQNPAEHRILAVTISKQPLGPAVRRGDSQWFNIVKWVVFATFAAEEYGLTSTNVEQQFVENQNPTIQRFLGYIPDEVEALGLEEKAFFNMIKQVGNYAEIYERNFGETTPTYIPRGLNSSYVDGGLLYAPPIR